MTTQVFVFGSLRVVVDGRRLTARDFGGRKPKQLLEILVLSSGRYVPKDQLAHLLWGDDLPHSASGSLEHYVSLLRRRLVPERGGGPGVIVTGHGGYRFDPSDAWVDLTQFDELFDVHAGISAVRRASFTLEYLVERDGVDRELSAGAGHDLDARRDASARL